MIRLLLPLALLACTAGAQSDPISPTAFRDRIAVEARQTGRTVTVIDERSLRLTARDGSIATLNTDNAYQEYLADPARLAVLVQRFVRAMTRPAASETVDQLVVVVRPSDYVERSMPASAPRNNFPAKRAMAGDLSFFLAVDSPETIRMANTTDLTRWGLTEAQAWPRAIANGRTRIGQLSVERGDGGQGTGITTAASGLAPSALADPAACGPAAPDGVRGQVVLVFGRNTYLSAEPADRAQTAAFWTIARRTIAARTSLSDTPVTCRGGRWIVAPAP